MKEMATMFSKKSQCITYPPMESTRSITNRAHGRKSEDTRRKANPTEVFVNSNHNPGKIYFWCNLQNMKFPELTNLFSIKARSFFITSLP